MSTPPESSALEAPVTAFGSTPARQVIIECLRVQSSVAPRGRIARAFGRSPLSADSRSWYLGALGEREVARRLAGLGDGWTVLHSVPVGVRGSDIDHVLIGPGGVFTINTKFHDDAKVWVGARRILVNGQKTDHLRNSRFEAERAARLLSAAIGADVAVQPVLAIVGAREVTVKERPKDVAVLRDRELVRWLRRRPASLDATTRAHLAAVPTTWAVAPDAEVVDLGRFDALHDEVRAAKRVRLLWASLGLLALITATATPLLMQALG